VNTPSVGELLQEASREVRSIMWEVTALDGPALGAAWPAFAVHARDAMAAMPQNDAASRLLIDRAAGPRPRPNRWGPPIDAEPDPHLFRAGQALASVADLLRRHAMPARSLETQHDADLARHRIAECLLVGAHATTLGLLEHASRLQPARAGIAFDRPEKRLAVNGANQVQSRRLASELSTFEAHVAHHLARQPGREPRQATQDIDLDRLAQAVAQWEVAALRVLHAQPPSVRDLAGIAHTEQALLVHTLVILNASARASAIDPSDFDRQIRPRLESAQVAWGDVAASWPAQMSTPAPPSMAGVEASAQLHRALDEITRNGTVWATPSQLAERVDLTEVLVLLRDVVDASGSRAERFAELPTELARGGHLHAPARLLAAIERQGRGREPEVENSVRATDVANKRIVAVQPEQTVAATATARHLRRQLNSLVEVLETLPLGREKLAVVGPESNSQAAAREVHLAGPAHARVHRDRLAPTYATKAEPSAGRRF